MFDYNLNMMKRSASNMNLRLNSHTAAQKKKLNVTKRSIAYEKVYTYIYFDEGGKKAVLT